MTELPVSSLSALFRPQSIAVIGASSDPRKIGGRPIDYLKTAGFRGRILPVNPSQASIQGLQAFASIGDVPGTVDQVILGLPTALAEAAVDACIAKGVRSIVMFTSGFGEVDEAGLLRQQALAARCTASGIRLLGPNTIGLCNVGDGVMATFSASIPGLQLRKGPIAVVSQSGAFGTYLFTLLARRGAGFSHFVATGNEADVDVASAVEWLADDPDTSVIVMTMEGCRDGARLRRALERARVNRKPVLAMKVGASDLGAAAAASHTGALAGSDAAYQTVFEAGGAWRAASIDEMVDGAMACAQGCFPRSRRMGIITISGGIGVLMTDAAAAAGLELPALPDAAQSSIRAMLPFASPRNPVDATAQIVNDRTLLDRTMDIVVDQGGFDIVVVFFALMGLNDGRMLEARTSLLALRARDPGRLFVLVLICSDAIRKTLEDDGFVVMEEPARAIQLCALLAHFAPAWARFAPPPPAALQPAAALGMESLDEAAAKRLLAEAGVPFVPERVCTTARQAAEQAAELGFPVVLKVLSPDLIHKSDVGGVRLDLRSGADVEAAWVAMMQDVAAASPSARITGGLVAPMVRGGVETVIGVQRDPTFGPLVMFGLGGVFVEVLRDVALRLAPLTLEAARAQIAAIKGVALLQGARGSQPVDIDAIAHTLVAVANFAVRHADTVESVEINPFIALPNGGFAVDAVILRRPNQA